MTTRVVAGIDQGTSSTFAGIYDENGRQLASARRRSVTTHPRPGWDEQDGAQLLHDIEDSLAEALSRVEATTELIGIGLANQGESVIAFDRRTGKPLSPAILWSDRRSSPIVDALRGTAAQEIIEQRTGLPLDPYYSAGKISWMLRTLPEVREAGASGRLAIGTLDTFFVHNLSLQKTLLTDPSTASRTQLMNLDTLSFDPECAEAFGIDPDLLAPISPTVFDEPVRTHLGAPLRASSCDTQAALAALGGVNSGDIKITYGTGCFINANVGSSPVRAPAGLMPTFGWSIGADLRTWLIEGGVFSAATAVDWLVSLGLADNPPHVSRLAAQVDADQDTMFLPSFTGVGAPWWRPAAAGVLSGLRTSTTAADIAHAVLEGVAQRASDIVEAMPGIIDGVDSLRVDGGLSASRPLIQMQADLTGLSILCSAEKDSTSVGVAGYASIGAGILDLPTLAARAEFAPAVQPIRSDDWRQERRALWRKFIEATRAVDPDQLRSPASGGDA